jgi:nitroreductase
MIEAATWAPSSTNVQPWRFIVVTRGEVIAEMARMISDRCQELSRRADATGENRLAAFFRFMRAHGSFFADASAVIVACKVAYDIDRFGLDPQGLLARAEELGGCGLEAMLVRTVEKSVAMAVQNLLLKAYELGYGGCPMDAPLIIEEELYRMLSIPDGQEVVMVIPLGLPAHWPSSPRRKPLTDVMRYV